jgi:hypothetical protein
VKAAAADDVAGSRGTNDDDNGYDADQCNELETLRRRRRQVARNVDAASSPLSFVGDSEGSLGNLNVFTNETNSSRHGYQMLQ